MIPVDTWPVRRLTTTTAISMMFIGSRSWSPATAQIDGGASAAISFGPYDVSRLAASEAVSPDSASDPAAATTSSAPSAYGAVCSPIPDDCPNPCSVTDISFTLDSRPSGCDGSTCGATAYRGTVIRREGLMDQAMVVVGASLAGVKAVEGMRSAGFRGRIVLVGEEEELPYERPPLSKAVLVGADPVEKAFCHDPGWYDEQRVELRLGRTATGLDAGARTITLDDGEELGYDKLLLATGSRVRRIDVPGAGLAGVHYLRTMAESVRLRDRLVDGAEVVIVGAGWVGLETASAAAQRGCRVTVVEPRPTPLHGVVGPEVGGYFTGLHEGHGVTFRFDDGVDRFEGVDQVTHVLTSGGDRLPADVVVVGVGIVPNTELAASAGLAVDNGIVVRCLAALVRPVGVRRRRRRELAEPHRGSAHPGRALGERRRGRHRSGPRDGR